jgi:hypothetical protein
MDEMVHATSALLHWVDGGMIGVGRGGRRKREEKEEEGGRRKEEGGGRMPS